MVRQYRRHAVWEGPQAWPCNTGLAPPVAATFTTGSLGNTGNTGTNKSRSLHWRQRIRHRRFNPLHRRSNIGFDRQLRIFNPGSYNTGIATWGGQHRLVNAGGFNTGVGAPGRTTGSFNAGITTGGCSTNTGWSNTGGRQHWRFANGQCQHRRPHHGNLTTASWRRAITRGLVKPFGTHSVVPAVADVTGALLVSPPSFRSSILSIPLRDRPHRADALEHRHPRSTLSIPPYHRDPITHPGSSLMLFNRHVRLAPDLRSGPQPKAYPFTSTHQLGTRRHCTSRSTYPTDHPGLPLKC